MFQPFVDQIAMPLVVIVTLPVTANVDWDGQVGHVRSAKSYQDVSTGIATNHWNANVTQDTLESYAKLVSTIIYLLLYAH